jgi:hypothetical protein
MRYLYNHWTVAETETTNLEEALQQKNSKLETKIHWFIQQSVSRQVLSFFQSQLST